MFQINTAIASNVWDAWLKKQPHTVFIQSSQYGDFYRAMGERSWIWGIMNEAGDLIGGSLMVSVHARRGNFILLPYGPMFASSMTVSEREEALALFVKELREFARREGYAFIRCSPFLPNNREWQAAFGHHGFRPAPLHVLAEYNWLLDITKSEDELLMAMEKNHRNLIRRCQKEGVRIDISTSLEALADFNQLLDVTAARQKFFRFPVKYVEREFNAFASHGEAAVIRGYLADGTLDTAAVFMFYGTMSCYRHAASNLTDKKIPTSYLVQWAAIQEAKRRGCTIHNFWGIAPPQAGKDHPFYGLTHFKAGFGGYAYNLLPCHDLPLSSRYWLTWVVEKIRSVRRGFSS